jgi:hypothetical protein
LGQIGYLALPGTYQPSSPRPYRASQLSRWEDKLPYVIDGNGIQVPTYTEITTQLLANYASTYGPGVLTASANQDGQQINFYAQMQMDVSAMLLNDYNSRDGNSAIGVQLDQLFWAITPRNGGESTIYALAVTVPGAVTLYGTDQTVNPSDTVQDPQGNQYQLETTISLPSAGTYTLNYEAVDPGNVSSALNTITIAVTVHVPNITYNNPTAPIVQGEDQETDFAYRMRALASTAQASQGFFDSLDATLEEVPQASQVQLYENPLGTDSPNAACTVAGVSAHGIWAIVNGAASPAAIAQTIYAQRSLGCNMRGEQSYTITRYDGSTFTVYFDFSTTEALFIQMTLQSIDGITPPNISAIIAQLPSKLTFVPGQESNINAIATAVQEIDPNTVVTACGVSNSVSGPFTATLSPSTAQQQFTLAAADIYALPMQLLPATASATHGSPGSTVQFTAYGGTQAFTYSISVNNSGGTINSSTGLYTAGNTGSVTDTVLATDGNGNTATATVAVT